MGINKVDPISVLNVQLPSRAYSMGAGPLIEARNRHELVLSRYLV